MLFFGVCQSVLLIFDKTILGETGARDAYYFRVAWKKNTKESSSQKTKKIYRQNYGNCPLQSISPNAAKISSLKDKCDSIAHLCIIPQWHHVNKAMGNPVPLGPVSIVLEHTLLSPALPLDSLSSTCSVPSSTGAWRNLKGRGKTDEERGGKRSLIALHLLFSEEEAFLLLTAFCMKVKFLPSVEGLECLFSSPFSFSVPLMCPSSSLSFSLRGHSSFFVPPSPPLSHHQAYRPSP